MHDLYEPCFFAQFQVRVGAYLLTAPLSAIPTQVPLTVRDIVNLNEQNILYRSILKIIYFFSISLTHLVLQKGQRCIWRSLFHEQQFCACTISVTQQDQRRHQMYEHI